MLLGIYFFSFLLGVAAVRLSMLLLPASDLPESEINRINLAIYQTGAAVLAAWIMRQTPWALLMTVTLAGFFGTFVVNWLSLAVMRRHKPLIILQRAALHSILSGIVLSVIAFGLFTIFALQMAKNWH